MKRLRRGLHWLRRRRLAYILVIMGLGLLACLLIASAFGAVSISPLDMLKMSLNKLGFGFRPTWASSDETIFFHIRLIRVTAGALIGASLATAGVIFQGLLRNPLADPYVIGTSAGAALGATLAMLLPLSFTFYGFGLLPLAAFIGALTTVLVVYNLARVGGKTPVVSMLLAGFAVSSLLMAGMFFLVTVSSRLELKLHSVLSFLLGGVSVITWEQLAIVGPVILVGIVLARLFALQLNAFSLGEDGAAYLGVDVERDKMILLALGALLTGAAVSLSGLIGFVGLVVPHAVRLVLGPDHRYLLPASAIAGAGFLVMADLLARTVLAPTELPVGIFTALIGAPFFMYLLRSRRREYAF